MDAGTEDTSRYDSVVAAASELVVGDATILGEALQLLYRLPVRRDESQ